MNSNNFFSALPNFINGVHTLQNELIMGAYVIAAAGLMIHTIHALVGKNLAVMFPTLVRLALVPIVIMTLQTWGDLLVTAVNGLVADVGGNGNGANVFQDYQNAVARKLGTAAAAANVNQSNLANVPLTEGDTSGGFTQPALTGVTLTDYGYEPPSSPNYDTNSANGIGAFPFDTAPGSLIANYSAALSPDMAAKYNLQPGQTFTITTTTGQVYNLQYADKTADYLTGRVDIYSPSGQLGGDNFSQQVSSINNGPVTAGQTGLASMMPNPGGSIGDQVLWAITLGLSWVAMGVQYLMTIAQQILYLIEIAISPLFIACLMVPALSYLATRYFMVLVGVCLWPLAWGICNLVTILLIDFAVNPTGNNVIGGLNTASVVTGPLAGIAALLVVAVWVIGSTVLAPVAIGILLGGGGSGAAAIFGATLGSAAMGAARMSAGPAASGAASMIGGIGGRDPSPVSTASGSRMNGGKSMFGRRPLDEDGL
jgi:hypothetical protein